jgi:membrane protease YdiL (CAAX protease family)
MNEIVATEPSRYAHRSDGRSEFGLTRLIFAMVGVFAGYRAFSWFSGFYLARTIHSNPNGVVASVANLPYPTRAIFVLVEMIVVIYLYRPVRDLFVISNLQSERDHWIREATVGAAIGILVFFLAIPFLQNLNTRMLINTVFPGNQPLSLRSIAYAFVLGVALPAAGEIVFRGIVLRTLHTYSSTLAAILLSTLLFVSIWPLFGIPVSLLVGVVASVLYSWRKSLVSPIFADVVFTLSGGIYMLYRIWV